MVLWQLHILATAVKHILQDTQSRIIIEMIIIPNCFKRIPNEEREREMKECECERNVTVSRLHSANRFVNYRSWLRIEDTPKGAAYTINY